MNDLKQRLSADHEELERQLRALACAVDANDAPSDLHQCWTCFETSLREHLDAEERTIFPVVASDHRQEVEALRAEHQLIRQSLAELGLALELHTLRKAAVDELIAFLHQHAARENGSLYDWLDSDQHRHSLRSLRAMFEQRSHGQGIHGSEPAGVRSSDT